MAYIVGNLNGTRCRDGVKVLWCHSHLVNPQRASAARVTVLGLCVCVCVCVSVTQHLTLYVIIRATNDSNLPSGR